VARSKRLGGIPHHGGGEAVVAIAAGVARLACAHAHVNALAVIRWFGIGLAKVAQQPHTAAVGGFGQAQQRVELAAHDLFELFARRALVDHAALVHHVVQAVGHPRVGGLAVAPGAAGFLVIAFDVFGHVQVRHKAHIGLVDAHAKGNGGHHDHALFAQKFGLIGLTLMRRQAGVIHHRREATRLQGCSDLLGLRT